MTGYDKARIELNSKACDKGIYSKIVRMGHCIRNFGIEVPKNRCDGSTDRKCNQCIKRNLELEYKENK